MAASYQRRFHWPSYIALVFLSISILPAMGQQSLASGDSSLGGVVRDAQGNAVAHANIALMRQNSSETASTATDATGHYSFNQLPQGVYSLHVKSAASGEGEVSSIFVAPRQSKTVDVALSILQTIPQFYDQPQFTVSGVTDTTSLGGHGSDTVVRTRESVAKQTASLSRNSGEVSAENTVLENSLIENLKRDPNSFDANFRLGELLLASGRSRQAIPYLERAGELRPADHKTAYDLARAHLISGEYDLARAQARKLLATQDQVPQEQAAAHHLLADAEEKLGHSLEAVREYERAAITAPTEPFLFDWGSELLLHHAPEPAEEVFDKGKRLFPESMRMRIGLGAASFARGSYERAVQTLCEASDLNPDDPAPYLFLGKMQMAQNSATPELVEKLHRFVTSQPQNAEANYYYAVALWKVKRTVPEASAMSSVESLLGNAISLNPGFAPAELQLGIVRAEQGDNAGAVPHYTRAIQIDPQLEEAHYRLAQAYRQLGLTDKAKDELRLEEELAKKSSQQVERERHDIPQFVYTLRGQPSSQNR